jgi:cell division transport system permease protein
VIAQILSEMRALIVPERPSDRVVPPSGPTARLTSFAAGAMAFLAVFALALSMASGRLATRWDASLARTATIRVSAPSDQMSSQVQTIMDLLATTPGIARSRVMEEDEQRKLLEPWFGPDLPLDALPLPRLIEITEDSSGYDSEGLRQRLAAEAPGAVLDDHTRWRRPLVEAAGRLRSVGLLSILLIAATTGAVITLAATAALAANAQVIQVLRLVGATDAYIAQAFVRRFTLRALLGAGCGAVLGMITVALIPAAQTEGGFLTGLGFQGWGWLIPLIIPPLAAIVAFAATRAAALARLKELN